MRGVKNREGNKWKKWTAFLFLFLLFGFLLNSVRNVYKKKEVAQEALARMEKQKTELEERQKILKESLAKLATDDGMAIEIRKKLNVAQAGESVAVIVDEKQNTPPPVSSISSWQKIKDFFSWLFK
jgi:cell division protein FtsB